MIYLDSSAVLKLLVEESESGALAAWLLERVTIPVISSELARLEVVRAARRLDPGIVPAARLLISQLDLLPLSGEVIGAAADIGEPMLRSLDAIHLTSMYVGGRGSDRIRGLRSAACRCSPQRRAPSRSAVVGAAHFARRGSTADWCSVTSPR